MKMKKKTITVFLLVALCTMLLITAFAETHSTNISEKLAGIDTNSRWYQNYFGKHDESTVNKHISDDDITEEMLALDEGEFDNISLYNANANDTFSGWKSCGVMTTARSYMSSVAAGNNIYTFGGTESGVVTSKSEFYDTNTETWNSKTDMPIGRYKHNSVVYDNKVYICGGYDENNNGIEYIDVYDIAEDQWGETIATPNHNTRYAAGVYNNELYIFGGEENGETSTKIYKYNFENQSWLYVKSYSELGSDNIVFQNETGFRIINEWNIYDYNILLSTLKKIDSVPRKVYDYTAVGVGQYMYIIGGRDKKDSGVSITNVKYRYDSDTDNIGYSNWIQEWYNDIRLIRGLACHNTVVANNNMYVFGGQISYGVDQKLMFKRSLDDVQDDYPDDKTYPWTRYVYGSINNDGDNDRFTFIPNEDGYYEIRTLGTIHSNNGTSGQYGFSINIDDYNGKNIIGSLYPIDFGAVYMEKEKEYIIGIFDIESIVRGNYMYEIVKVNDDLPDEIENAVPVGMNQDIKKSFIGRYDVDCVKFNAPSVGNYRITVDMYQNEPLGDNTLPLGKLYNDNFECISDLSEDTTCDLEQGTYYISLYPNGNMYCTTTSKYNLKITQESIIEPTPTPVLKDKTDFNAEQGKVYNLAVTVTDMSNIKDKVFTVDYDSTKLLLQDACAQTWKKDNSVGEADGTDIEILALSDSQIKFKTGKTQSPISGTINMLSFSGLLDGTATVTVTIE